jgi:hypothetical protein
MSIEPSALTPSQLLGAASEMLAEGGYSVVSTPTAWAGTTRVFEDPYGIVALHIYETWAQLTDAWEIAQGELVDLISDHFTRSAPKAWEGYLALFSLGPVPSGEWTKVTELRYDTNRVRKLVATREELQTLDDVRTALLPLLPLDSKAIGPAGGGILDSLPSLIADKRLSQHMVEEAIDAYNSNQSIVERLHAFRGGEP